MSGYDSISKVAKIFKEHALAQMIDENKRKDEMLNQLKRVEVMYSHNGTIHSHGQFDNGTFVSFVVPGYTLYRVTMDYSDLIVMNDLALTEIYLGGCRMMSYRDSVNIFIWIPHQSDTNRRDEDCTDTRLNIMFASRERKFIITIEFVHISKTDWECIKTRVLTNCATASSYKDGIEKQRQLFNNLVFTNDIFKAQRIKIIDISFQVRSVSRLFQHHNRFDSLESEFDEAWPRDFRPFLFDDIVANLIGSPLPDNHRIT